MSKIKLITNNTAEIWLIILCNLTGQSPDLEYLSKWKVVFYCFSIMHMSFTSFGSQLCG